MIHKPLAFFTLLVLAVCTFVGMSSAGTVIHAVNLTPIERQCTISDIQGGWIDPTIPMTVPSFNTALGTLTKTRLITNYSPTYHAVGENTSPSAIPNQSGWWSGWQHTHQVMFSYRPYQQNPYNYDYIVGHAAASHMSPYWLQPGTGDFLTAYDGVTDFAGTSGFDTGVFSDYMNIPIIFSATTNRELEWWSSGTTRTFYLEPRMLSETWPVFYGHHWTGGQTINMNFASQVYVEYTYQ